jgi:hypothetical protein
MLMDEDCFGSFPGRELDRDALEMLLWTRWPDKERKREPKLFQTKWWDYRLLHPAASTYLFAHLYTEETRRVIREHINDAAAVITASGSVRDWYPIKAGDIFEPPASERQADYWKRKIGGLIRSRQAADEDGIPYPLYIREALKHFYFGKGSYVLGRTQAKIVEINLLAGDEVRGVIATRWLEEVQIKVQTAAHPRYLRVHDTTHLDHTAYRAWLHQQLGLRSAPEHARARLEKLGHL